MSAKGKVSTEELLQLTELGIPAFEILQKELGLTGEQLEESLRKGAIGADEGITALLAGMTEKFNGAMDAQSKTFLGTWSNIQDNFGQIMIQIGQDLIEGLNLQPILEKVGEFTDKFRQALEEGNLIDAIKKVFPPEVIGTIVTIAGAIIGAMVPAFIALATTIGTALVGLAPFIAAGAAIAALAFLLITNWDLVVAFFNEKLMPIFQELTPLWQTIKIVLTQIWDTIKTAAIEIWTAIKDLIVGENDDTKNNITIILEAIRKFWGKWGDDILKVSSVVFAQIGNIIKTAVNIIKNIILLVLNIVQGNWGGAWENIKSITKTAVDFITSTIDKLGAVGEFVKKVFSGVISTVNSAISRINKFGFSIPEKIGGIPIPVIGGTSFDLNIPLLQFGGDITAGGIAVVGEAGPELVRLPRGAQVEPLDDRAKAGITLNQSLNVNATPEQLQIFTERALRKIAMDFNL